MRAPRPMQMHICTVYISKSFTSNLDIIQRTSRLMYTSTIVHLPHIDQLLSPCPRNLIRQLLVAERLPCSLDDVHLVSRAGRAGGEVLEAGGASELEDEMLGAETEAYVRVSGAERELEEYEVLPGGLENNCTFVAPTFRSRFPNVVLFS